jgi:hypothetical protein
MIDRVTVFKTLTFYILTLFALIVSLQEIKDPIRFLFVFIVYIIVWYLYFSLLWGYKNLI